MGGFVDRRGRWWGRRLVCEVREGGGGRWLGCGFLREGVGEMGVCYLSTAMGRYDVGDEREWKR